MRNAWEALVAAVVDSSAFNGHMPPIATSPVTAEVAEMPGFLHVPFHLFLCKLTFHDQSDEADIDYEFVIARRICPMEDTLDSTLRTPVAASWRWAGTEPAVVAAHTIKEPVDIMDVLLHLFHYDISWGVHEVSLAC